MAKIHYDKDVQILNIRLSNRKSVDSDMNGNVVVDYDRNGNVVNVEIMNFSFNEFSQVESYLPQFLQRTK